MSAMLLQLRRRARSCLAAALAPPHARHTATRQTAISGWHRRCFSSAKPHPPAEAATHAKQTIKHTNPVAAAVAPIVQPTPTQPPPLQPLHVAPASAQQLQQLRSRLSGPPVRSVSAAHGRSSVLLPPRVLCLDVGDRYIGVALSSEENDTAHPLLTMQRKELVASQDKHPQPLSIHSHHTGPRIKTHIDLRGPAASSRRTLVARSPSLLAAELRALIERHHCVAIVVGLPLTLDYTLDAQCHKTMLFVESIRQEWHKPLTRTADAQRVMQQAHANMIAAEAEFLSQGKRKSIATPPPRASSKPASASSSLTAFTPPPLLWWDERLSSVDARAQLEARGVKNRSAAMAQQTDALAAAVVLQELLDRMRSS